MTPNGVKEKLPDLFENVQLKAMQFGQGVTALLAEFTLTEDGSNSLNETWHSHHEPRLLKRDFLLPLDRKTAAIRNVRAKRQSIHRTAREWLGQRAPGHFYSDNNSQPVFDLLLFEKHSPFAKQPENPQNQEAFEALGLDIDPLTTVTTEEIPQLILSGPGGGLGRGQRHEPTWTLWGNLHSLLTNEPANQWLEILDKPEHAVSRSVDHLFQGLFVSLSLSAYLRNVEESVAISRDQITLHRKFSRRTAEELRKSLLAFSFNYIVAQAEIERAWSDHTWLRNLPKMESRPTPRTEERYSESEILEQLTEDFIEVLHKKQEETISRLSRVDSGYREILLTATNLGASASSLRISTLAIVVAGLSALVALGTLALTEPGSESIWDLWSEWIMSLLD